MVTGQESGLLIRDDIGWVRMGESLRTATATEYVAEIDVLRRAVSNALEYLKGRMPCPAGECCNELRAQITKLERVLA